MATKNNFSGVFNTLLLIAKHYYITVNGITRNRTFNFPELVSIYVKMEKNCSISDNINTSRTLYISVNNIYIF